MWTMKSMVTRLAKLNEILRGYPGNMEVSLIANLEMGEQVQMTLRKHRVAISPELRGRLNDLT